MTMHARKPEGLLVTAGVNAHAHQRVDDRHSCFLRKSQYFRLGSAVYRAASHEQNRTLGVIDRYSCRLQHLAQIISNDRLAISFLRFRPFHLRALYAARYVDKHRARAALSCQKESLPQGWKKLFGSSDESVVFRNRNCDADNVDLLKGIPA